MNRPLVLLHGFTGSPESWTEVRRMLDGGPIFAPAALGHDSTAGPPGIESFEDEVDRLAGLIRDDGLTDSHLAGYSMGGRLALGLLIRHPELFASGTLIGASPGLTDGVERHARAAHDEDWARLLDEEGLDTFVAAWEALPLFETQGRLGPQALAAQARIRRSHDPAGLARSLRVVGLARMPDYRPRLGEIRIPVRLVVGARDRKFRRLAADMAERLPGARMTFVTGAGHNVVLERPTEIAALLREDMHP